MPAGFLCMELYKWLNNFSRLLKIADKTTNLIFKFDSSYLVLFINFSCEITSTNVFQHEISNYLQGFILEVSGAYCKLKIFVLYLS